MTPAIATCTLVVLANRIHRMHGLTEEKDKESKVSGEFRPSL